MAFNRRFGLVLLILILLACGVYLQASGFGRLIHNQIVMALNKPEGSFDPAKTAVQPDYALLQNWAAIPGKDGPAMLVPAGLNDAVTQGESPVDVFYIHPTGYLSGASWTSPMDSSSSTEENTEWMMAYQASIFNGCCNIYAPRYREASIYAYLAESTEERDEVLDFAYRDVEAAFDYFIEHHNSGRPFIVASHSQGTHHATRLISDRIDQSPLREQLVAAYLLGATVIGVKPEWVNSLHYITICETAEQTGCFNHWDTIADNGLAIANLIPSVCINPLNWSSSGGRVPASRHQGALPVRHVFNINFVYDDSPQRDAVTRLDAPLPGLTWAECRDGILRVGRLNRDDFADLNRLGNYHVLDYTLFYVDIRENAKVRIQSFFQARDDA